MHYRRAKTPGATYLFTIVTTTIVRTLFQTSAKTLDSSLARLLRKRPENRIPTLSTKNCPECCDNRQPIFRSAETIVLLRQAFHTVKAESPFAIDAIAPVRMNQYVSLV